MTDNRTSDRNFTPEEAATLLSFYVEAGVSDVFCDEVQNRYQLVDDSASSPAKTNASEPARRAPVRGALRESPAPNFQPSSPTMAAQTIALNESEAADLARQIAAQAKTLEELREAIARFDGCPLRNTAKNTVFGDGDANARVMLIGEAPGRDEDIEGVPFAGHAGHLLDRMLAAIGLDRGSVYLANMLPWRPPGNRMPTPAEQAICLPFIARQIELCTPDILVLTGGIAARQLLGISTPLPRLRGQWKEYRPKDTAKGGGLSIPALTMFAPDHLLLHPTHKRLAWQDLLALKSKIEALPPRH
jgi:DNA polymerase